MKVAATFALAFIGAALAIAIAVLLVGCGGGGCNPCEPDVPTPKVDCKANPTQCK